MPTKRKRRQRHLREPMPFWAFRMLEEGKPPERGEPGFHEYIGWLFFEDRVPGLPDENSIEGRNLAHQMIVAGKSLTNSCSSSTV